MHSDREFLGTQPIGPLLKQLAIPTVTAQLINMLYNIVDRIYIGHIPNEGAAALTGLGVCVPLIMIVSAFAAFCGSGGAPRSSIAMGRGDWEDAEHIMGNCFVLQIFISVVLTVFMLLCHRPLLLMFGASENTIEYACSYMRIYSMGTIFVQLTLGMNAFITAQGFTKVSMKSVMIGAVTNIILDPVFIYGMNMGVAGAALATILAQGCSCLWVLLFLCGKKSNIRLRTSCMKPQKDILLPCFALGLAMFIMNSSESIIFVCYNSSLLKYGGDIAVGAMTILMSVTQLAMLPLQGVGQGAQPIISYNYGAGNADRVRAAFKLLIKVNMTYAVCMWMFVQGFPQIFTTLFTNDAALAEFAKTALRVYFAVLFMFGIQISCQMTFGALGNAKASIMVAVARKFVLMIPLIYLLPAVLPVDKTIAVYLAEPVSDFFAMTFTAVLFYFQFKKAMDFIDANKVN